MLMDEFSFIDYLKKKIPVSGGVLLGVGDDAAAGEPFQGTPRLALIPKALLRFSFCYF